MADSVITPHSSSMILHRKARAQGAYTLAVRHPLGLSDNGSGPASVALLSLQKRAVAGNRPSPTSQHGRNQSRRWYGAQDKHQSGEVLRPVMNHNATPAPATAAQAATLREVG